MEQNFSLYLLYDKSNAMKIYDRIWKSDFVFDIQNKMLRKNSVKVAAAAF